MTASTSRPRSAAASRLLAPAGGAMLVLSILACSGGGSEDSATASDAEWTINDLALAPDGLNYAEVSGKVTLQDDLAGFGTTAEVRYYSDEYETLILETSETIGEDLEEPGTTQEFAITHYEVYVVPATGGYEKVCAEFRADDSTNEDWTQVGCMP